MPPLPNTTNRSRWALHREDAQQRGELLLAIEVERWYPLIAPEVAERENARLRDRLIRPQSASGTGLEPELWRGHLYPVELPERVDYEQMRTAAERLEFRRRHFAYARFAEEVTAGGGEVALSGLWLFPAYYRRTLDRARTQGAELRMLQQSLTGTTPFARLLPSEQCVELLLRNVLRPFARFWDGVAFKHAVASAHPEVREFAERWLLNESNPTSPEAEEDFRRCCRSDFALLLVQDTLDDASGRGLARLLPADLGGATGTDTGGGIAGKLQRLVGRLGFRERLERAGKSGAGGALTFEPSFLPLGGDGDASWYNLHAEELTARLNWAASRNDLYAGLEDRWRQRMAYQLKVLTAPVLDWVAEGTDYAPQWRTPDPVVVHAAEQRHAVHQRRVEAEMERIERLLPKLRTVSSLVGLRELERKRSVFETATARERWRHLVDRQRQQVLSKQAVRERQREEFGFDEVAYKPGEEDVWLDELLRVEEEVRPYMAYVRRAFQAALPVGSTIEFNPYRHRHDGVEFDPETIQDQEKWLRGEVLKTLRSRRNYAPITQVNVFCLDFSRSMNHDLMRNLFKVVFLLVSGLEGRDTYDAIHFFGSKFRETVSFTDATGFTSRKALARILSHIATIELNSVVYSGFGGTNISDAVAQSHARIEAFSQRLQEERPEVRFVKSVILLTDGQPTVGILNLGKLREFIQGYREQGDVAIKGIYLKHPDDQSDFMAQIFGPLHAVEATGFEELVATFVQTMSLTYRRQRKEYRAAQKRRRLLGERTENPSANAQ